MGGIIGLQGNKNAAQLTQIGLFSVQHRGQESCGITTWDSKRKEFNHHKNSGLVMNSFPAEVLARLEGDSAVGHVRYPTSGIKSGLQDAQPFMFRTSHGNIAIALSGNIINTELLYKKLHANGAIFQHTSETELIVHLLAHEKGTLESALKKTLEQIEGGYAGIILAENKLIAFRDRYGLRPLVLGKVGDCYVAASETSAIEVMGGVTIREIKPAEMLVIENNKLKSYQFTKPGKQNTCIFEQVYLSRPDSVIRGQSVAKARMEMGKKLAQQLKGVKADLVMPVPDSGFFAAMGFAKESGLPLEMGLVRNHYMGRSFLKSAQNVREMVVRLKLLPIDDVVRGKDIVLVDDSLVRGTTSKKLIKILREHGAHKIHFALTSPPIISPCFYGINTPQKKELIACTHTHEQIVKEIGADSVTFITSPNAAKACGGKQGPEGFCSCCFTGKYINKISKATMDKR